MTLLSRPLLCAVPMLLLVSGCQDDGAMMPASETGTGGETGASTGETDTATTGDEPTTTDPGAPTTGEPVPCDGPEGCTAMGGGEIAATSVPFFRGEVCVNDAARTGDALVMSMSTCMHPCLTTDGGYAHKWLYRCQAGACEIAVVFYHPKVTGSQCPADVFGEFDPAACVFTPPVPVALTPPTTMGAASLLLPFVTNMDAVAIDGGEKGDTEVWARIDAHAQGMDRRIAVVFADDNPMHPEACGPGMAGCTCSKIGLP